MKTKELTAGLTFDSGFNQGYLMAKYRPGLAQKYFSMIRPMNDYLKGILSGKQQFDKEKAKAA